MRYASKLFSTMNSRDPKKRRYEMSKSKTKKISTVSVPRRTVPRDDKALEHAWKWFELHATQRMTMIRFYLIIAVAIGAGLGFLWNGKEFLLALLLSIFGTVASICFWRLDKRVSRLVKVGEEALKTQQKQFLADEMRICQRADSLHHPNGRRKHCWPYSYSENFMVLFVLAAVLFAYVGHQSCVSLPNCERHIPSLDTPADKTPKTVKKPVIHTGLPAYN